MEPALSLTTNDIEIFQVLQEYPALSLPFIGELVGYKPHIKKLNNNRLDIRYQYLRQRLRDLRKAGYLRWPVNTRPRKGQINRPAVYTLLPSARQELARRHLYAPLFKLTNNINHDLGSCFIVASFKLGTMERDDLRFIPPQEILAHEYCPPGTRQAEHPFAIPVKYWHRERYVETLKRHDWAPFGIEHNGRKILFAGIEYDRDTEGSESADPERSSVERHLRMVLALLDGGYKSHYGTKKFFVPIVTTTIARMEQMKQQLLSLTEGKGSPHILFRVMTDWETEGVFPKADGHMLTVPWGRAGHAPFDILKEMGAA